MRRQRNMAQMKEQNKTSEQELNKMEINNLSDAEFKTLVVRMLQELIGYFNRIKKTQAAMKFALSEIRKIYREPTMERMKRPKWDECWENLQKSSSGTIPSPSPPHTQPQRVKRVSPPWRLPKVLPHTIYRCLLYNRPCY